MWTICVIGGSLAPQLLMQRAEEYVPVLAWSDKFLHVTGYFLLAYLAVFSFDRRRSGIYAALCMIALGAALEFAQMATPTRTPDWHDALANTLGVLCGIAVASLL